MSKTESLQLAAAKEPMSKLEKLRWVSAGLTLVGLLDSVYLTWIKLTHRLAVCNNIGDCEAVNNSIYSEIGSTDIPIAVMGAGAFLVMLIVLLLEKRVSIFEDNGVVVVLALSMIGVLYSAYLTYIEIFVLKAICPYCVLSAVVLVILLIVTLVRFLQPQGE